MTTLTIKKKTNTSGQPITIGKILVIDSEKIKGVESKSLKTRIHHTNDHAFLTQKGNGGTAAGDVAALYISQIVEVNENLFSRIWHLAEKAKAIISID